MRVPLTLKHYIVVGEVRQQWRNGSQAKSTILHVSLEHGTYLEALFRYIPYEASKVPLVSVS